MKKIVSTALVGLLLTGCASIINDKTQKVNVTSSTGEKISGTVNGQPFEAPGVVSLLREKSSKVFITNTAGCVKETNVDKTVDPIFFVNILTGGFFGSTTDYSTEKMWKYSDNIVISCQK